MRPFRARPAGALSPQLLLAAAASAALLLSGCGSSDSADPADSSGGSDAGDAPTITVFAAASLLDTFDQLADDFSGDPDVLDEFGDVTVRMSFAGSSELVSQIVEGAPADVIATADERTMQQLVDEAVTDADPQTFVTNTLVIAVPRGNPDGITGLESLAGPGLDVVVCAPQVPCGAATDKVADAAGVTLTPVSESPSVTDVLGSVAQGQADAGLVYATDAAGSDAVDAVEFPEAADAVNRYPIAPLTEAGDPALAQAFVDHILSDDARAVFDDAGFAHP